ncbi:fimbrial protein [Comamonas composti]|uniref:fimbrial protein n=1 Tax=Comamonas composti TaxID=408558 RepID=UPI001B7FD09B|nr:fimbrial protein [Comamonas composti]
MGSARTVASHEIRPGDGVSTGNWTGACDTCNGSLGLPGVVNVGDASFQPHPALIASAVAPITQYGSAGGYSPEQVFFRCAPGDAVYEMFSTNGDDLYSGYYNGGDAMGTALGLPAAYRTAWANVLLRLTHIATGEYITHVWKERRLTGLDLDSRGFQLVKAKNLSAVRSELYSAPLEPGVSFPYRPSTQSQMYLRAQPAAYIAIKGPGLPYPNVGQPHASGNWGGFYARWPGAIGLYRSVTLKRFPTCAVLMVTPQVIFAPITQAELNSGGSTSMSFEVLFKCQAGAQSSTAPGATALGVLVSAGARAASSALALANASGGLAYLVSDNYGQSGMAGGVGIRILRNRVPMNLLVEESSAAGVNATDAGWYPVIGPASQYQGGAGGASIFSEMFEARLEKLRVGVQPAVTPGRVRATAQIVIRVQ